MEVGMDGMDWGVWGGSGDACGKRVIRIRQLWMWGC